MEGIKSCNEQVDCIISSDESSLCGDMGIDANPDINLSVDSVANNGPATIDQRSGHTASPDVIIQKAKSYQHYMKHVQIPTRRGSIIPFTTWMGLGMSMKQLYGQPLHYLTTLQLMEWDRSRFGSEDSNQPLHSIIDPRKAEANVWLVEEVHRLTSSHHHIAKLWRSDHMHEAFVDPVFPQS